MRETFSVAIVTLLLLSFSPSVMSPAAQEKQTLTINGQPSQVAITQVNGHPFAELEGLARAVNGSLSFSGNQIALTLPVPASSSSSASSPDPSSGTPALARSFLRAGIEAMSSVREWHTALATAIRNQYPFTDEGLATYRDQAATNLRLASVAISNDSDRSAFPVLTSAFNKMKQLSDKYVSKRQSATYIFPDSLQGDDLDKRLVGCGHFIAAMFASGQFQDDGSCQ